MITEDYVSFEVAKLLKEKGFYSSYCCYYYFTDIESKTPCVTDKVIDINEDKYLAPTLQMAMKWLRVACAIEISIACFKIDSYRYDIYEINSSYFKRQDIEFNSDEFYSYEEACEAAIKYCLENLI